MERDELWAKKRDVLIHALETYLAQRGSGDRKRKILEGIYTYLKGDKETEDEFYEALSDRAQLVRIPLKIGETGRYELSHVDTIFGPTEIDEIELTIFPHQVWTCPRCGKVYALFNEAADGGL